MQLAKYLAKRRRDVIGINQKQLAERLRVSHFTISRWEAGGVKPSLDMCERWAQALGTSVREALTDVTITIDITRQTTC
jgi:transcriptional regulator with XRE-family HTH domain